MIPFIDTHCHLDLFQNIQKNVSLENTPNIKTITVTNAPFLWPANNKLFENCENIRVALGLHPELAAERVQEIATFKQYCEQARYIGEIGLDGSVPHKDTLSKQLVVFKEILNAIKGSEKKVVTVHSRGAATKVIEELNKELKNTPHKIILHWFTGNMAELKAAIDAGFYFSVNHKMLSSDKGQKMITAIPFSQILTETDAPFTFDSKFKSREESLKFTVAELAMIQGIQFLEAKDSIYNNFRRLLY